MTRTLFALCRVDGQNVVRRVPLEAGVQPEVAGIFDQQEQAFFEGKDEPVAFTGSWKPDGNELLCINDPALLAQLNGTLVNGAGAYERLDISDYSNAGIKALFMHSEQIDNGILIQKFRTSQYLQRKWLTLTFSDNQFGKLDDDGFSFDDRLGAVVQNDSVMFVSFHVLRSFLTVQQHFAEATAQEVQDFADHESFHHEDETKFEANMDERCRKLIRGIHRSNVLRDHAAAEIIEKAGTVGLELGEQDGKIVLPSEKRDLKIVLSFLEESVYKGVFSGDTLMTNSKRPVA
ncbi:Kiwa anti-phage protein KwaB-like domain-containing protein [Ruegeria arenilitoris]|uniref:Kiwa anti-phage protein KwaB-like domain-containing protein n=1 Tax=Ruegeria arenilitoris TaxID=1173585 RepID=UPI00147A2138|nr:Kiwa anti-phage protein KwaB-like domain-containing protein [Ruegeria arenilitoris]